jgi:hypothetical protein
LAESGLGNVHSNLMADFEFVKIDGVESIIKGIAEFLSILSTFIVRYG